MGPDTFIDLIGVWIAALLTLGVYSSLIKDTFISKLTEAVFVGVSFGMSIVFTYYNGIKPKIEEPLVRYYQNLHVDYATVTNAVTRTVEKIADAKTLPAESATEELADEIASRSFDTNRFFAVLDSALYKQTLKLQSTNDVAVSLQSAFASSEINLVDKATVMGALNDYFKGYKTVPTSRHFWVLYIFISVLLGLMFITRFFPKHAWLSRFPMAYTIGIGVGMGTPLSFQSQIMQQVQASFIPMLVRSGNGIDWLATFGNLSLVIGTLTVLYYFFFSFKKEDAASRGATKIGIAYLMIGFGASFAFTIMARVSLLIGRINFLQDEWIQGTIEFFKYYN
ncbi:hypothetical protein J6U78_03270 [bacterium]|nr:hypothetical protein [bacterium]